MLIRKIALNSVLSIFFKAAGTLAALSVLGLLTRRLGQDGFGEYATILAFLYVFTVLADFGLYSINVREISKPGADEKKIASAALTMRAALGFFVFGLATAFVQLLPYSSNIKIGLIIGAVGFWFLSNNQVLVGIFQKYLKMGLVGIGELAGRLVQLGLVIFFIKKGAGFFEMLLAMSVGAFFNFLLVFLFARRYVKIGISFNFALWKKIFMAGLPLAIATVLVTIYFKLDTIMLSLMKGASDVGIYGLSYKILEGIIFFPAMLVGLVMPLLSKYFSEQKNIFWEIVQKTLKTLLVFILPMIVGTLFLSKKLIILIGGKDFVVSSGVLSILIFACGFIFLGALFSNALIAAEKQKALAWIYGAGAVVNVGTNFILIPKYSYLGAAGTTVFTEFLVTFLMIVVLFRVFKKWPSFEGFFRILAASVLMGLVLYFLKSQGLLLLVFVGGLVYFISLWLFGGLPREFRKIWSG